MRKKTVLVMAGGTGGHIMPALAVAEHLRTKDWHVVWMGNPGSMDARLVPARGFSMLWINFSALRGKGLLRKLMLPLALLFGFAQAFLQIRRLRPDGVIGFGGYVSFPGGMMASLLGCPLVVHEQNSVAGLSNKVLATVADRVLCGFPSALNKGVWVGNPVRPEIAALPFPAARFAGRSGPLRLLVVGGSLGAAALNSIVPQALALLPTERRPIVTHQAGEKHLDVLQKNYQSAAVDANCIRFIDDLAAAYAEADVVICRSGALTVAELAAAGVAALLVPFPFAVDDHQTWNARFLADTGAAFLLPQSELTPEALAQRLDKLTRSALQAMAEAARVQAKPEATQVVAKVLEDLAQ